MASDTNKKEENKKEIIKDPVNTVNDANASDNKDKVYEDEIDVLNLELSKLKPVKLYRHKKEALIYYITILFNFICYICLGVFSVLAATNDEFRDLLVRYTELDRETIDFFIQIGGYAIIAFIAIVVIKIIALNRSFVGVSSLRDVRLSDSKYNFLFEYYVKYCRLYGLKHIPAVYLSDSSPNSQLFGMTIYSNMGISVPTKVFKESVAKNDYSYCKYFLCRRIAHIALGYNELYYQLLTLWTSLIPPFKNLIQRVKCYSVDGSVAAVLGKEITSNGIFYENYRSDLYDDISIEEIISKKYHCNQLEAYGRFIESFDEEHPFAYNRIDAILHDKDGRLF